MTELAQIRKLVMRYGATQALNDVSLAIRAGSYTVLLGPSGSGKTTLLSILGGFLQPTSGHVFIKGEDCTTMTPARRPTATVFQDYALFPHMTVGANVGFGLRMRGVARTERDGRAQAMLDTVGLPDAFHKKPHQLSGGQRQRVALARALVVEPQLLLLDEPLGALDLKLRRQMQDELKALQQRVGTTFVHVTHDQEESMALADHIVVMNKGRIEDQGAPEQVYARPATAFSASFMGESTLIPASSVIAQRLGAASMVAIRPEHISFANAPDALGEAVVDTIVYQGSFKRVMAHSKLDPSVVFNIRAEAALRIAVGEKVSLGVDPRDVVLLNR
jgi:spermidine/putrescine transport system ATP-binding protein